MNQKICLVTGANSGIGKEIALALAISGAQVIMVCRNAERGAKAQQEIQALSGSNTIDLFIADLSSQTDIRSLAKKIHAHYTKLDVLINNAGLILTKKEFSVDGIEMTLATNHLGPFLFTHLLLDLLEQAAPARIINISSTIHTWAKLDLADVQFEHKKYHFMQAYAQSKLFMNMVTFELARRLANKSITVNCVHPGAVRTHLGSDSANNFALKMIDKLIKLFFMTPAKAAKFSTYLALSPSMATITGKYFVKGKPVAASPTSYDPTATTNVWHMSEKLVGL